MVEEKIVEENHYVSVNEDLLKHIDPSLLTQLEPMERQKLDKDLIYFVPIEDEPHGHESTINYYSESVFREKIDEKKIKYNNRGNRI